MTSRYKVMCGCECFMSVKSIHSSLLTWSDCRLKRLKSRSQNAQNRRSGEIFSCIFETYKNAVQPHGCHIYNTSVDMAMETMFPCTSKHHGLSYCKCVLCCCDKYQIIVLTIQEANKDTTNTCPTIRFHG